MSGEEKPKKQTRRRRKKKAEAQEASTEQKAVEAAEEVKAPRKVVEGDFVLVDYVVRVKETGELVETTIEEVGKKEKPGASQTYEPRLVIPGKGLLLKAIEDEIVGMELGQEKRFEVPPEKAFGPRDPSKVRVLPLRRLKDVEGPITVGSRITIEGKEGIVRSIGSGRVQIDFNPYLAGKHLDCYVKIVKIVEDSVEKIKALIRTRIPDVEAEKFQVDLAKPEVKITVPQDAYLLPALQVSKRILAKDIIDHIEGVEKVTYLESYERQMFQ